MIAGIAIALLVIVVVGGFLVLESSCLEDEAEHSIGWHRANGKYRVLYPDGQYSQPFSLRTARDYASIFGGKVVPKEHKA